MKNWKNIGIGLLLLMASFSVVSAQDRINFTTWAGSADIVITQVGGQPRNLNFSGKNGGKVNFLVAGSNPVTINVEDTQALVYKIEAPSGFDITVELTAPSNLELQGSSPLMTIPLTLRMAYSNDAVSSGSFPNPLAAIPVPPGFNSVTFPISKRTSEGPPLPPSLAFGDGAGGVIRDKSSAFVFIYGELGQVPAGSPAGNYTASVELRVYAAGN